MLILALSDAVKWEEPQFLGVDKVKPDITILAGDLSWDGTIRVARAKNRSHRERELLINFI